MAGLQKKKDVYHCQFRWQGRKYTIKVGAVTQQAAQAKAGTVDHLLHKLAQGYVTLPEGIDIRTFVLHDGQPPIVVVERVAEKRQNVSLKVLRDTYLNAVRHSLETNTVKLLELHFRHLVTTYSERWETSQLSVAELQRHIDRRAGAKGRNGQPPGPSTIRKELVTLRTAISWAKESGLITVELPGWKALRFPKADEKPSFMTWEEIERDGGGHWDCLYLRAAEVEEMLEYLKSRNVQPWVYPMACFAAHTGARRSEIIRAMISDIDFEAGCITIRERKRIKGKRSTRRVPLTQFLRGVLQEYINSVAGPYLFSQGRVIRSKKRRTGLQPVTKDEARDHLRRALDSGKWTVVRGWHVLRHSFISACVLKGVDQRVLDSWVGHTTNIRERYTHLSPSDTQSIIEGVFG